MDDYRKYRSTNSSSPAGREYGDDRRGDYSSSSRSRGELQPSSSSKYGGGSSSKYGGGSGGGGEGYRKYGGSDSYSRGGRSAYAGSDQDEDDDVEAIKSQLRRTKEDTRDTTRRAVAKLQETEQMASSTLNSLGQQSDQIINVERNLDLADMHTDTALDRAAELKRLNKSIFAISVRNPFGGKKRKEAEIAKIKAEQARANALTADDAQARYQTEARIKDANAKYGESAYANRYAHGREGPDGRDDRSRYLFEDEDPEVEDEIDRNLDYMGDAVGRLRGMGLAMNEELTVQNERLDRVRDKTDGLSEKVAIGDARVRRFLK